MEFTGDEKKIQALFYELSLEQLSRTPSFEKLWNGANTSVPAPLVPRPVLAIVTAAILFAVCSIATWSWYTSSQTAVNIPAQTIPTRTASRPEQLLIADSKDLRTVHPRKPRPRPNERAAIRQAAVISNWQSPTNILLNSPVASFLSSLPQLNQSARDLEQFLPKNNDVMKESKQ
jgi:hypothetical protein